MSEIITLCDMTSAILDRCMAPVGDTRTIRLIISAIQQAMRDLPKRNKWNYYKQLLRFTVTAQVSPAVTYTESNKTMVITDGSTWPSDVVFGEVMYNNIYYKVVDRVNNTTITIDTPGLGADYTGTIAWNRSRYTFSRTFTKIDYLINLATRLPIMYMDTATFYERQRLIRFSGIPTLFTMQGSTAPGYTDIVLCPPAISPYTYEGLVTVIPHVPKIYKVTANDGAITSGTKSFSSATGSFPADCTATVLRIYASPSDIPFGTPVFESIVRSRDSATALTLETAPTSTYSGASYVLSSMLEIDTGLMQTMVENLSYANYCQNHDHKGLAQAEAISKKTLLEAIAADTKLNHSTSRDFGWQLAWTRPHEYAQVMGPT